MSSAAKKQERHTCWSVTINNPIAADDENIQLARQKGWRVDGQPERGKEGTLHYQLIVKTPQVRFSAVKKQFPRAHIDPARNVAALEQYVHKQDTKAGELPETSEYYPSLSKLWMMFTEWYDNGIGRCGEGSYLPPPHGDRALEMFDAFISDIICKGYHVETMGVNPQTRSCVVKYLDAIFVRSRKMVDIRRQTDRQTDEQIVETESITTDGSS